MICRNCGLEIDLDNRLGKIYEYWHHVPRKYGCINALRELDTDPRIYGLTNDHLAQPLLLEDYLTEALKC